MALNKLCHCHTVHIYFKNVHTPSVENFEIRQWEFDDDVCVFRPIYTHTQDEESWNLKFIWGFRNAMHTMNAVQIEKYLHNRRVRQFLTTQYQISIIMCCYVAIYLSLFLSPCAFISSYYIPNQIFVLIIFLTWAKQSDRLRRRIISVRNKLSTCQPLFKTEQRQHN